MKNHDILFFVVIFNEEIEKTTVYKSLLYKVDNIIFYDNSLIEDINRKFKYKNNYISNNQNPGLSFAYNYGADYARRKGYKWLLLTDQDTFFPEDALKIYNTAIKNNPTINLFIPKVKTQRGKYMSPVRMHHYLTSLQDSCPTGIINPSDYGIINSGLLINVDAFWKVGGYNERVWLDFADFQFIERFSAFYREAYVLDVECLQAFSNEEQSVNQKLSRYKHFCTSVKHYEPVNKLNKFWINLIVLKRACSLCIQSKSLSPIITYFQEYLL